MVTDKRNRPTIEQLRKVGGSMEVNGKRYTIRANGSMSVASVDFPPTKAQQQFKDETDANLIVARHNKNLHREKFNADPEMYRNLSKQPTYFEALNIIREADSAFQALPSKTRALFENDPDKLLQFVHDPKKYDEGVQLGIFKPKPPKNDPSPQPTSPSNVSNQSQSQSPSQSQTTSTTSKS